MCSPIGPSIKRSGATGNVQDDLRMANCGICSNEERSCCFNEYDLLAPVDFRYCPLCVLEYWCQKKKKHFGNINVWPTLLNFGLWLQNICASASSILIHFVQSLKMQLMNNAPIAGDVSHGAPDSRLWLRCSNLRCHGHWSFWRMCNLFLVPTMMAFCWCRDGIPSLGEENGWTWFFQSWIAEFKLEPIFLK